MTYERTSHVAPKVICLTPVKNEAWILGRFLACASLWADHIVVLDQSSEDGSRQIASGFRKVALLDNPALAFNECERQKLLLDAAREIPGRRVIVALDADEFITAHWRWSPEWQSVLQAKEGTLVYFPLMNVMPGFRSCWRSHTLPFGYVDDGAPHKGNHIHSHRVPVHATSPALHLQDVRVLHYQYTDWERMKSKQRWYQCWETLHQPEHRPAYLYRRYHQMDAISPDLLEPFQREWIAGYEQAGIDMSSTRVEPAYRWDRDVLQLVATHGSKRFRRTAIWDIDWAERQRRTDGKAGEAPIEDPRRAVDKLVLRWLRCTQGKRDNVWVQRIDNRILRLLGW